MELAMQQEKAKQLRADIIKMLYLCQSGHPGGSLSLVEMLMAIYYNTAHVDPKNPKWEDRDRIVLSKVTAARHSTPFWQIWVSSPGRICGPCASCTATCRAIPTATRRRALM